MTNISWIDATTQERPPVKEAVIPDSFTAETAGGTFDIVEATKWWSDIGRGTSFLRWSSIPTTWEQNSGRIIGRWSNHCCPPA